MKPPEARPRSCAPITPWPLFHSREMAAMQNVRVRLRFEGRRVLSKSQRKEGLRRSWIQPKPQHETVSDLAIHLMHAFELQESCHRGLILSMDGFVLPPFESTSALKDKDVVWVKGKEGSSTGTARLCGGKNSIMALEIVDKQPANRNLRLLASEEFIKETVVMKVSPKKMKTNYLQILTV